MRVFNIFLIGIFFLTSSLSQAHHCDKYYKRYKRDLKRAEVVGVPGSAAAARVGSALGGPLVGLGASAGTAGTAALFYKHAKKNLKKYKQCMAEDSARKIKAQREREKRLKEKKRKENDSLNEVGL
jgi:hypothetical protein